MNIFDKLTIKIRIVLVVFILEITGYSLLLLYNNQYSKDALLKIRTNQIDDKLKSSLNKINSITSLMEQKAKDLALTGEQIYILNKKNPKSKENLIISVKKYLSNNFESFPISIGGGLWYEPYAFDNNKKYFGPYAFWQNGQVEFTWDLNTPEYDYHNQNWYKLAIPINHDLTQKREKNFYWTEPYFDEAGSQALMMTVDTFMYDENKKIIGISTVDWAMTEMTSFIEKIKITNDSYPFLIETQSKKFVSYPLNPAVVMSNSNAIPWGNILVENQEKSKVKHLSNIFIDNKSSYIYYIGTDIGLIFGMIIPEREIAKEIDEITKKNLINGAIISIIFILLVITCCEYLFRPFNRVFDLIKNSISLKENEKIKLKKLIYNEKNEFTPIIKVLNKIYDTVENYTQQLTRVNHEFEVQQSQIEKLNQELESKFKERTIELEGKNTELSRTLNELRYAQKQLVESEKMASLGTMVAGIAHEINTPVGVGITATTHLIDSVKKCKEEFEENKLTKSNFKELLDTTDSCSNILFENLNRASKLIKDFKSIAIDNCSNDNRIFNVKEYLEKLLASLKPQFSKRSQTIELNCPDNFEIKNNPGEFSQIITNLIVNSLIHAFSPTDIGKILIDIFEENNNIVIKFQDNGKGISEKIINKIYDPFVTTARGSGGTGLGMYIIYNLVTNKFNGDIKCESSIGKGTTFTITFPKYIGK